MCLRGVGAGVGGTGGRGARGAQTKTDILLLDSPTGDFYSITLTYMSLCFSGSVNSIFHMKICGTFLFYGPDMDCECLLEPP